MLRTLSIAAVSLAALLSTGVLAQSAPEVLTGEAAFGNWQDDAPGVRRLIRPQDLPAPQVQAEATSNAPGNAPRPDGLMPKVPDGFAIELVAEGIENPRTIAFAPNGDLFVANSDAGEVLVYRFGEGSATPTEQSVFVEKLNQPYGIAFYPPDGEPEWIYISESDGLKRYPYKSGDLKAPEEGMEPLVQGIPGERHWTRSIAFTPDGSTLLYAVGSGSNVGENMDREPPGGLDAWIDEYPLGASWGPEERRATLLSFAADGTSEEYYATGLRNCSGVTIQPATGTPWCVVNERDEIGDNVPFDYATSVKQGAFYGWPWYYIGDNPDPRWEEQPRDDLKGQVTVPDVLFQTHSAPLNIAFYDSDAWGPEMKGDAFVAMHGSWNRGTRTGYKIVRLPFDENGAPSGEYEDFITGFVLDDASVWGRPVGIAVAPDGALFFSEDGSGTIWRVTATGS
jgi:glucose/arabinose dehydrogenase